MKLELAYSDHIQLSESLNELGQTTRITQLEPGEGKYTMSFKQSAGMRAGEQLGRLTSIGLHQPAN
jgi:hypothetical protein